MRTLVYSVLNALVAFAFGCSTPASMPQPQPGSAMEAPVSSPEAPEVRCSYDLANFPFTSQVKGDITAATPSAYCKVQPLFGGESYRVGLFIFGTAYAVTARPGGHDASDPAVFDMSAQQLGNPGWSCADWTGTYDIAGDGSELKLDVQCAAGGRYAVKLDLAGAL